MAALLLKWMRQTIIYYILRAPGTQSLGHQDKSRERGVYHSALLSGFGYNRNKQNSLWKSFRAFKLVSALVLQTAWVIY